MTIRCVDLRCERLVDPIGVGTATPRLTWRLDADGGETGVVQQAWQVETDGDWRQGRVEGWRQQATYEGLASGQRVRWRVRVWTNAGASEWSHWASFEAGLLAPGDWVAQMITADSVTPVMRFSRTVDVPSDVVVARLHVTAQGVVTTTIDGTEVSADVLTPGWMSYAKRLPVRTYDVTALVHAGSVELASTVAPGWFSGRLGFADAGPIYGERLGLLAQLELTTADGERVVVGTDESWRANATRHTLASIYDGETYDARLPAVGAEARVDLVEGFDHRVLFAPAAPPVRVTQELGGEQLANGVVDFGQNLVGWLRIEVRGAPAGTEIVLRHAEVLDGEGNLFTAPLRTAAATDRYITRGEPAEMWEPRFTFHGFRYATVEGVASANVDVIARVVHTDCEPIGTFECSDPLLNRLHENAVWGWRGNSVSLPTDCPQRDERLGWTGDAQVFAPTASFLYDCETFWENWLADLAADQRDDGAVPHVVPTVPRADMFGCAGWGDAAITVPWSTYVAYGDDTVLRNALASMRAWNDFVWGRLDENHLWNRDFQFGDWVDPDAPTDQPWRAKAKFDLVATAYFAYVSDLLFRIAVIVDDEELAATAFSRAETVRAAWWEHFADAAATTQTGAALAIAFGLTPHDEARVEMGDALALRVHEAGDHLGTGFLGTPILLPALADTGHLDVAYDVLLQRTCPSWLYTVLAGGTTIWERWDALRPDGTVAMENLGGGSGGSMVSFNHYALGAVAEWMHGAIAGLRPDPGDPGYHHVLIEPRPGGGLTHASASVRTRYGDTSVAWRLDGDALRLDVTLPPNTTATVRLPGSEPVTLGSGTHSLP